MSFISFAMPMTYMLFVNQHKDINEIEKLLNVKFPDVIGWCVDDKLSIHFGKQYSLLQNLKKKHGEW